MKLERVGKSLVCVAALIAGCANLDPENAAAIDPLSATSRCSTGPGGDISCTHQSTTIDGRSVVYQLPVGTAPAGGWPVVFNFQGSFFAPSVMWSWSALSTTTLLGGENEVKLIKALLDAGYAVVTPAADLSGGAWDTNLPPWSIFWPPAPDNSFLGKLFAAIDNGSLGPLSTTRWYATGVSSGGYMTSRMAVSYQSRFLALAIESGSYATCGGPLCSVPALPANHPPTLFLHGALDPIVPVATMLSYRDKLNGMGVPTRTVINPAFMHGWIPEAPAEVLAWFQSH